MAGRGNHPYVRDPFSHQLVLVVRDDDGLIAFTGCGHSGVLNMVKAVIEHFPDSRIKAVVGGLHLIGLPAPETMAGSKDEMVALGQDMRKMPVDAYWTGHCTGHKAFETLKLEFRATPSQHPPLRDLQKLLALSDSPARMLEIFSVGLQGFEYQNRAIMTRF